MVSTAALFQGGVAFRIDEQQDFAMLPCRRLGAAVICPAYGVEAIVSVIKPNTFVRFVRRILAAEDGR